MQPDGPTLIRTFVDALATKDRPRLTALLADDIDFRGLTPSEGWRGTTPDRVAEIVFGSWFEPEDHVREVEELETHPVADRTAIRYRLLVDSDGEPHVVEQQGFLTADGGRITRLSLVCSGYRPLDEATTG